jgi:uncharacterized membrane protein YphA (DoxX/SURF4 family)
MSDSLAMPSQVNPVEPEKTRQEGSLASQSMREAINVSWSQPLRITFQFCFVYFILFSLSNQILSGLVLIPKFEFPDLGTLWPMRQITFWTAAHVFRVTRTLVYKDSGSGDKTYDWVQVFLFLVFALVITIVWTLLDRRRLNYIRLYKWFRVFIRFALASEMFLYGFDKIIPQQMPLPSLARLMEPYGNFSPMSVLWSAVGASRPYEIFTGSAEAIGGLLLLVPRTTTLGALICLADLIQIFMLNMTYDVPVKLFSINLILLSLFLLAPEFRRLINFFFSDRTTGPPSHLQLFWSRRANRMAIVLQLVIGLYLMAMNLYSGVHAWHTFGGGRPKPSL